MSEDGVLSSLHQNRPISWESSNREERRDKGQSVGKGSGEASRGEGCQRARRYVAKKRLRGMVGKTELKLFLGFIFLI